MKICSILLLPLGNGKAYDKSILALGGIKDILDLFECPYMKAVVSRQERQIGRAKGSDGAWEVPSFSINHATVAFPEEVTHWSDENWLPQCIPGPYTHS